MQKLFLLDAYALIYRSYYAFIKNPRINSKGLNTSAIVGFLNTLNEVLEKEKPTHIGVAFDPHGPTFRSEAFPEYNGPARRDTRGYPQGSANHQGSAPCLSHPYPSGTMVSKADDVHRYTGQKSRFHRCGNLYVDYLIKTMDSW
jgi:5''-3'' exonuclease (including N-terminal domain of PolI)